MPVAVKDEIDIAGQVTSRGTAITATASADAEVVRRLRDAGAIVIGKTTTMLCIDAIDEPLAGVCVVAELPTTVRSSPARTKPLDGTAEVVPPDNPANIPSTLCAQERD